MRVLMISGDRLLFDPKSAVYARMRDYGELFDELHIVVTTTSRMGHTEMKIGERVWVYPTNTFFKFSMARKARAIGVSLPKPDVVSAQDPFELGSAARSIAKSHGAKLQIQIHTDFKNPAYAAESVKNRARVKLAKANIEGADCVRVVSKRILKSLTNYTLARAPIVLPLYTDVSSILHMQPAFTLHERYPQFNFIVLMASRLSEEKDIATGLRAFKLLLAEDKKAGLVIVGDGPKRKALLKLARELGIQESVVFTGWEHDLRTYFKTADVFLNTSRYEGYGATLIEAAAAECPIVSTNVGIIGEILLNYQHALVAPVGESEQLAAHLKRYLADNVQRQRIAYAAREQIKERYVESYEQYLSRIRDSYTTCGQGSEA